MGLIRCMADFQKPCVLKTAGLRVKDTSRFLCYPVLCGHCLPSCQAGHQAHGLLVFVQCDFLPLLLAHEKAVDIGNTNDLLLLSVYTPICWFERLVLNMPIQQVHNSRYRSWHTLITCISHRMFHLKGCPPHYSCYIMDMLWSLRY